MTPIVSDHELIRNTIARYCLGIDFREWDLFAKAFTKDVKIIYPDPIGSLDGIPSTVAKVQAMLGSLQTQHALSTQVIELIDNKRAKATTYCTAFHFGNGEDEGRDVTGWGAYKDDLVKGAVAGEGWRIVRREILPIGPLKGDAALLATQGAHR
ncbi:hypothetical protein CC79DRAFT_1376362 [Sarocladium strictum]